MWSNQRESEMTEKPLVSVIINCYNGEKYLREAIDSVIAQTYENWELVFWDNQSTDSTREIVESYKNPKIRYFYAPEHTPLGEARNLAVEKANGEYINFLDADDVWSANKLEEQVKLIVPGEVELVYTPFKLKLEGNVDEHMIEVFFQLFTLQDKRVADYNVLLKSNFIVFSSVLLKKELYKEIGGINKDFRQYEDYELLLKCSLLTKFAIEKNSYVKYRIHGSNSSSDNRGVGYKELDQILRSLPESWDRNIALKKNKACQIWSLYKSKVLAANDFINYCLCGGFFWIMLVMKEKMIRNIIYRINRGKIRFLFA